MQRHAPAAPLDRARNVEAMRPRARRAGGAGEVVDGQPFEIWDDAGRMLATVPFRDALKFCAAVRNT